MSSDAHQIEALERALRIALGAMQGHPRAARAFADELAKDVPAYAAAVEAIGARESVMDQIAVIQEHRGC